jgi:hypothetical protein
MGEAEMRRYVLSEQMLLKICQEYSGWLKDMETTESFQDYLKRRYGRYFKEVIK